MTPDSTDLPLIWNTTQEASAFDPSHWFEYCERISGRSTPVVPSLAIQTVIPAHFQLVCDRYGVRPDNFTLADHPFAVFEHDGVSLVIALSAKGSYAAGGLDELIALGAKTIIFLGGSGAISDKVDVDDMFIPTKALRDECVSLHYMPPSRYAYPSEMLTNALMETSAAQHRPVKSGPAWTIMAHFRQAIPRLRAFRDEGCLVVNNEASSAFAVGHARNVDVAALLNVGDTLASEQFVIPPDHAQLYQAEDAAQQLNIAISTLVRLGKMAGR